MKGFSDIAAKLSVEFSSEGSILCQIVFAVVAMLALGYLLRGIFIMKRRSVESFNFILLCIPILIWGLLLFVRSRCEFSEDLNIWFGAANVLLELFIPVLLLLHIQSQVNYHPVNAATRSAWLVFPVVLTAIWLGHNAVPEINLSFFFPEITAPYSIACIIFMVITAVRAYLLCATVFYQMPKHMRNSTYPLICAVTAMVIVYIIEAYFSLSYSEANIVLSIAVIIVLMALHNAFFIANSSNVIVTSRDFIFSNLSTIVLTISLKGNILDWNKKSIEGCTPLPLPQYKEPYKHYRDRILSW